MSSLSFPPDKLAKVKELISRYPEGKQKSCHPARTAFGAGSFWRLAEYGNHGLCSATAQHSADRSI